MRAIKYMALFALVGSGCVSSHSFYLMNRQTGATGSAVVPANGHRGGPITIALSGKQFLGQWVLMESGGSVGLASTTATSPAGTAIASGTAIRLPTGGNGTVIASAPDGSTLHCTFTFSDWNLKGIGVCEDNHGGVYDLQIS